MYLKHHAGAESPVKAASFSSDGRIVTTVDSDLVVAACNATTGEKIAVPKLKIGDGAMPTWAPTKADMFARVERGPHWQHIVDGADQDGGIGGVGHIVGWLDEHGNEFGRFGSIDRLTKRAINVIWDTRKPAPTPARVPDKVKSWKLLVRHDIAEGLFEKGEFERNKDDATARIFADLNIDYEQYRSPQDQKLVFKIKWPGINDEGGCAWHDGAIFKLTHDEMIWAQTSSPLAEAVEGYEAIDVPYPGASGGSQFLGARNGSENNSSNLTMDAGGSWWASVGSFSNFGETLVIPGPVVGRVGGLVKVVELWVACYEGEYEGVTLEKAGWVPFSFSMAGKKGYSEEKKKDNALSGKNKLQNAKTTLSAVTKLAKGGNMQAGGSGETKSEGGGLEVTALRQRSTTPSLPNPLDDPPTARMTEKVIDYIGAMNVLYAGNNKGGQETTNGGDESKSSSTSKSECPAWVAERVATMRGDITGSKLLRAAAERRDASIFEVFIRLGLRIDNVADAQGGLLHAVVAPSDVAADRTTQTNAIKIVLMLAKHWGDKFGEYLNQPNKDGATALSLAIDQHIEQSDLVDCLLTNTADPLIADVKQRTGLHFACVRGHVRCATSLINNFVDVDAQDDTGRTPLLISSIRGSVPLVYLLLQNGARHDVSDNNGWLPLSYSLMHTMPTDATGDLPTDLHDLDGLDGVTYKCTIEGIDSTYDKQSDDRTSRSARSLGQAAHDRFMAMPPAGRALELKKEGVRVPLERPGNDRYETIAMALLKKENHLDSAIEDNIPLFTEALERHFRDERPELVKAYYDPTDSYDNDMYRDPLLQRAIDLDWTKKVFPAAAWALIKFSCFLTIVCLLGAVEAGQLSPSPHYLDQVFDTIFIGENWDDYGVKEFGDIGGAGELWPWIENVFLGGVYPDPEVWRDANGVLQASPVAANEWVGRPRMRTLEGSPETCAYNDTVESSVQCFSSELTTAPAWWTSSPNKTQQQQQDGFGWQAPGQGDVGWTSGFFHQYPDGGLMVIMPEDKAEAEALVAKLKAGDWINLNTRAFIVEFTAYNANTGLFTVGQIMVEMSRTGVYLPSFQFRNFPRVSYSFTNTSDIARLVLEVIFLIYFYAKYLRDECKQMGERWEDPVKEGSVHWKAGDEKEQGIRKQLADKLKDARPTLGSILVGNLDFKSERAQRIVDCIQSVGDCVVIRPYFYESFNYFDIGLILCFTGAVVVQVVQLVEEMTALPKICAGNAFVPGSFIISHMHSARMYLIAFGSFFCWCKVKAASHGHRGVGVVLLLWCASASCAIYTRREETSTPPHSHPYSLRVVLTRRSNPSNSPPLFPTSRCSSTCASARASPPCSSSSGA